MVRNRTKGNFLWHIYANADKAKQMLFKSKLFLSSHDETLWNKFNRFQTLEEKVNGFDAEIIGIMVQCFVSDDIKKRADSTDLEKLKLYDFISNFKHDSER